LTKISNTDKPDILIIGAGATGAAVAWSLSTSGIDVMCLDQGDWVSTSQYHTEEPAWELSRWSDFHAAPNQRNLPADYPVNDDESDIAPLMYNGVGGSTIHWGAHFPRFHPSDFKVRTLDGVADDFPYTYQDLVPFFDQNDHMMGVSGLDGDPFYPSKSPRPMPPLALGMLGETVARGFDQLGWHWWPSDAAIASTPYAEERLPCNYGSSCDLGCTRKAKASADITYWPPAIRSGARLITGARVSELLVSDDGNIKSVLYYKNGQLHEQSAKLVVLACNGVGTPRLLLNSTSNRFPQGLANGSGLVGKNLMFHPAAFVTGYFDENLQSNHGSVSNSIYSHQFYETENTRGFVRGYQLQVTHGSGPLWQARGGTKGSPLPWGSEHHDVFASRFNKSLNIVVLTEDLPEETNQVIIDPTLKDSDGIPAPKIIYKVGENTNKMLDHGIARAKEVLIASGANEVEISRLPKFAGWHLMGTARTGVNPSTSVVNSWGQSHEVPNLFIVDGSVLVTAGAVNVTSTIQAIALRTAEYIKQNRNNL